MHQHTLNRRTPKRRVVRVLAPLGAAAALTFGVAAPALAHPGSGHQRSHHRRHTHNGNSVPASLRPPAGNVLTARFAGRDVQVYQCTAGAWVLLEPAANLVGRSSGSSHVGRRSRIQTAIHYKGPTWESTTDGSLVQGATIASSPVPGSIPQLLLRATENRGTGIFGRVTFISRLKTRGGAAPSGSCSNGQTTSVPYAAQYLFYAPAGS